MNFNCIYFYLAQYNKQLRENFYEKLDIENDIFESQQRLAHQERKVCALDNLINVAEQSLDDYFEKVIATFFSSKEILNIFFIKLLAHGKCSCCNKRTLRCYPTNSL